MTVILVGRLVLAVGVLAVASCGGDPLVEDTHVTGLHFTTTSAFPDNPRPKDVDVTLSDPEPARAIYEATLALPAFPPGIFHCPASLGYGHKIDFVRGTTIVVTATLEGGCRPVTISGAPPVRQAGAAYWTLLASKLGVEESDFFAFPQP
jgi:hypothetical protein